MALHVLGTLDTRGLTGNTNDETEDVKARIVAANEAYSSVQTAFRSKQIY
jgi:hypothetical protein